MEWKRSTETEKKKKAKVERKTVMKGIYFVVDRMKKFELCTDTHTPYTHQRNQKEENSLEHFCLKGLWNAIFLVEIC